MPHEARVEDSGMMSTSDGWLDYVFAIAIALLIASLIWHR